MNQKILNKFKEATQEERDVYALTLIKALDHLNENLKEAADDFGYRRRETYRTQIALGAIEGWMNQAKKDLRLDKDKK